MAAKSLRVGLVERPPLASGDEKELGCGQRRATPVGVFAIMDMHGDGTEIEYAELLEADYTGIVAEFQTGSATTVLEASIDAWETAESHTEPITSTQRTNIVAREVGT